MGAATLRFVSTPFSPIIAVTSALHPLTENLARCNAEHEFRPRLGELPGLSSGLSESISGESHADEMDRIRRCFPVSPQLHQRPAHADSVRGAGAAVRQRA